MTELSGLLQILLGAGVASMILAVVAAIRKYRSGEIVDDDAIIARLDKDNESLRGLLNKKNEEFEEERRRRWHAEDEAAEYRRRLMIYESVNRDDS